MRRTWSGSSILHQLGKSACQGSGKCQHFSISGKKSPTTWPGAHWQSARAVAASRATQGRWQGSRALKTWVRPESGDTGYYTVTKLSKLSRRFLPPGNAQVL